MADYAGWLGRRQDEYSRHALTEHLEAFDIDRRVRLAAFDFLRRETGARGEVLPWRLLVRGFDFEGSRVSLASMQGIFKPSILPEIPLTFRTTPPSPRKPPPYPDRLDERGLLIYRYRGKDLAHGENVGLRLAMKRGVPLIYLYGIVPGEYMPIWPVFIVGDDPAGLAFSVAVDLKETIPVSGTEQPGTLAEGRRAYVTRLTQQRLHQQGFRTRVLRAYQERCAVCRLRHAELLDAAHILPDGHPKGEPIVANGLALCGLHHCAFDRSFLGIRPDLKIEIREDILRESDGPMLVHGLQGFQGARIIVPGRTELQPNREFLAERYEMFRRAG